MPKCFLSLLGTCSSSLDDRGRDIDKQQTTKVPRYRCKGHKHIQLVNVKFRVQRNCRLLYTRKLLKNAYCLGTFRHYTMVHRHQ